MSAVPRRPSPKRPSMTLRLAHTLAIATLVGSSLALFGGARVGQAAASLTIAPITWDVIGLDHNDPSTGPDTFPVGARVCNNGSSDATNLTVALAWDSEAELRLVRAGAGVVAQAIVPPHVTGYDAAYRSEMGSHDRARAAGIAKPSSRCSVSTRCASRPAWACAGVPGCSGGRS